MLNKQKRAWPKGRGARTRHSCQRTRLGSVPGPVCFIVSRNATSSSDVAVVAADVAAAFAAVAAFAVAAVVGWRPLSVCIFICGA